MKYPIAEKFKAPQGEGVYTGTPMAFIRFIGCSVGQKVCTHCDTDFDKVYPDLGGGLFTIEELQTWIGDYHHVCLTGGEPLDRDLSELLYYLAERSSIDKIHIETSGTKFPDWFRDILFQDQRRPIDMKLWLTVCPKPGWSLDMLGYADEIKVILGGLGDDEKGWPTITDALRWADMHGGSVPVYIQPVNHRKTVDIFEMEKALDEVSRHPELRLSVQMHKFLRTR